MSEQNRVDAVPSYTPEQISRFAKRDELPDGGLPMIDHLLWYKLRDIYNEHAMGVISSADGAERKREALSWAERAWEHKAYDDATIYRCVRLWKRVEEAAAVYRKDRTVQNADLLMAAIYGADLGTTDVQQKGVT